MSPPSRSAAGDDETSALPIERVSVPNSARTQILRVLSRPAEAAREPEARPPRGADGAPRWHSFASNSEPSTPLSSADPRPSLRPKASQSQCFWKRSTKWRPSLAATHPDLCASERPWGWGHLLRANNRADGESTCVAKGGLLDRAHARHIPRCDPHDAQSVKSCSASYARHNVAKSASGSRTQVRAPLRAFRGCLPVEVLRPTLGLHLQAVADALETCTARWQWSGGRWALRRRPTYPSIGCSPSRWTKGWTSLRRRPQTSCRCEPAPWGR